LTGLEFELHILSIFSQKTGEKMAKTFLFSFQNTHNSSPKNTFHFFLREQTVLPRRYVEKIVKTFFEDRTFCQNSNKIADFWRKNAI